MHRLGWLSLWIFTFCVPWQNMVMLSAVGTIGRAVGLAAGLIGCIAVLLHGRIRINDFAIIALIFFIYSSITFLWSPYPDQVFISIKSGFQLAAMVLLVHQFVHNSEHVRYFFLAYVAGAFVTAFGTLHALYTAPELDVTYRRFIASGFNENDGAYTMALAIPMAWHIALVARRWFHRCILLYVPLGFSAILLTGSRGGSVAALVALCTPVMHVSRSSPGKAAATLGVALLTGMGLWGMVQTMVPEDTLARVGTVMEGEKYSDSSALNGRLRNWLAGLEVLQRNPLIGTGAGTFAEATATLDGRGDDAHNAFVDTAAQLGVIGLVLFLLVLWHVAKHVLAAPAADRRTWYVLMAVLLLPLMVANWDMTKQMWLLFALATAYIKQYTPDLPVACGARVRVGPTRHNNALFGPRRSRIRGTYANSGSGGL